MSSLLPNSKFSFFLDEKLSEVLGNSVKVYGEKFIPYKLENIHPLSLWHGNLFPKHLEILNYSIDEYLDKIKEAHSK